MKTLLAFILSLLTTSHAFAIGGAAVAAGSWDARKTGPGVTNIARFSPSYTWTRTINGTEFAGGTISELRNLFGGDIKITNGTAAAQALLTNYVGVVNGKDVALFDGVNDYLRSGAIAQAVRPTTVYLVGRQVTWTGNDMLFDGLTEAYSGGVVQYSATPTVRAYSGTGIGNITTFTIGEFGILKCVWTSPSSISLNNGTPVAGANATKDTGGIYIGQQGGSGAPSNIEFADFIVLYGTQSDHYSNWSHWGLNKRYGLNGL